MTLELYKTKLCVEPYAGQEVTSAIRDAVKLALEQRCIVELKHNDRIVTIDVQPLIEAAFQQWRKQGREE